MAKPKATSGYNEQFFRRMKGPGPTFFGVLAVIVVISGLYLAFTKHLPFADPGYELKARFANSAQLALNSPVRIAGVNVGKVTNVELDGETSEVTFTVADDGLPIHDDASVRIRPRIFLEGNFFLDVDPGSPSADNLSEGDTIPVTRTATAVQLDEVLTALQSPARENLKQLLEGFGTALTYEPAPADDVGQDPAVKGESAAKSLNDTFDYGGKAGRDTAIVNDALTGTNPGDLAGLIKASQQTFSELGARESELQDLLTNFNDFSGALADESGNLGDTVRQLGPTLQTTRTSLANLDKALPPLRTFAIVLRPSVAELPATIKASGPFLDQADPLLSGSELGGIAALLADGTPELARATRATVGALPQITKLSRCVSEVLVPTGDETINDQFNIGSPTYKEFFYGLVGLAGESQGFDGNGPYVRFQPGGGPVLTRAQNPAGGAGVDTLSGRSIVAPVGTQPPLNKRPEFNSSRDCNRNSPPNLNGAAASIGPPSPVALP